jgi:exonuclease III
VDGYTIFRKDRNESGGGVALYVKESVKATQIFDAIHDDLELVCVRCTTKYREVVIVANVYRPPRIPIADFMEKLGEFACSLGDLTHKLILVGDLNVCALKPEFQQIQSFCNIMNMRQIINSPTHNERLIDHIYVAHSLTVQSHGIASPIEKQIGTY